MPKFFQSEIAAYDGDKNNFQNVKFKGSDFDSSTAAEKGGVLEVIPVHIKNPPIIQLVAYITSHSDRFGANYSAEQPFGRTNPFYVWTGNDRSITLGLDIPSSGISSALNNLNNLSWLLASLYPAYKDRGNANSVAASPLHRMRYGNLICSSTNDGQGLLGVIKGINVTHNVDSGYIHVNPKNIGSSFANAAGRILADAKFENYVSENKHFIIPKLMKIDFSFDVVHDHSLGWDFNTGQFRGAPAARSFPYDFGLVNPDNEVAAPPMGTPAASGAGAGVTQATPTDTQSQVEEHETDLIFGDQSGDQDDVAPVGQPTSDDNPAWGGSS